jgi:TonB family protein
MLAYAITASMIRNRIPELRAQIRACIDRNGRVDTVEILEPSGFLPYDADLINTIAAWRYRPVQVAGKPVPVCSTIQFVYREESACDRSLEDALRCRQGPPPS